MQTFRCHPRQILRPLSYPGMSANSGHYLGIMSGLYVTKDAADVSSAFAGSYAATGNLLRRPGLSYFLLSLRECLQFTVIEIDSISRDGIWGCAENVFPSQDLFILSWWCTKTRHMSLKRLINYRSEQSAKGLAML